MPIPSSTYRLQFREGMTFDKAQSLVPYLKRLGVSHIYASPIFAAASGSTHGYDVTDHAVIEPAIGGRDGFESFSRAASEAGLAILLDIVPNHMAASLENPWWRDVIEWGRSSRHATVFDIDWEQRLTLPFLGQGFAEELAAGNLKLAADREKGCLALSYFDQMYPLNPSTYMHVFRDSESEVARSVLTLSAQAAADAEEIFHAAMRALLSGPSGGEIDEIIEAHSRDQAFLSRLHDMQSWRLMDWRLAPKGLSYRRFFEITGLVGVRVEDPAVFDAVHKNVLGMLEEKLIDGLRIDHVDGLADPGVYLKKLRERIGPDTYLVVEKILGPGESLPEDWPVQGTTGYEFITALGELFSDHDGVQALDQAYRSIATTNATPSAMRRDAKLLMIRVNFAGEVAMLISLASQILLQGKEASFGEDDLRTALEELLVAFPVYRTYGGADGYSERDSALLDTVAEEASGKLDASGTEALKAVRQVLEDLPNSDLGARFRNRFQQLTGPLMAKSLEDTLFFRHNAFLGFNEVGGEIFEPERQGTGFHEQMAVRLETQPHGLTATATHDTKRGEDARARLLALSEDPATFIEGVERWRKGLASSIRKIDGKPAPEPEVEWMIFQTLASIWPAGSGDIPAQERESLETRLHQFVEKAVREAKLVSNWSAVNEDYEQAVKGYASALLSEVGGSFRQDFARTLEPFIRAGQLNSLSQTILKLTAPGVPDIYQGSEQTDYSLVDPDNRRMPDFDRLERGLSAGDGKGEIAWSDTSLADGSLKQQVITRLLHLRREHQALFDHGSYQPLGIEGQNREHLVGFLRRYEGKTCVVVVPRLTLKLKVGETADPEGGRTRVLLPDDMLDHPYHDVFTGRDIRFPEKDQQVSGFAAAGYSLMISYAG